MKLKKILYVIILSAVLIPIGSFAQQNEPWRADQLMEPADLATVLQQPDASKPLIISVGPSALIAQSIDAGEAHEKKNLTKLKNILKNQNKDAEIVIYCGCCPFKNCPNVRPAFELLNGMKFVNHKLLNLRTNIRVDWIDKGYPAKEN